LKVLHVASECAPFVKTGGLADVVGAIPKALLPLGVGVRVMLPAYPALNNWVNSGSTQMTYDNLFGGPARIISVDAEGLDLLLLDAPHLFDRPGNIYLDDNGKDWHDNHLRFGALCRAAADVAINGISGWKPDLVHAHDWQAGLVPLFLAMSLQAGTPDCIITIHNIAFQGLFEWQTHELFGIPEQFMTHEGAEYYGQLGFLKAGLAFSRKITTVSPTYARELLTPEFGMGLEGLLQARRDDFLGILNGIDLEVWDPNNDPALPVPYSVRNRTNKTKCKLVLEQRFGLDNDPASPLFCVVSRLTEQKGLDLLLEVLPDIVNRGARLALLGSGAAWLEQGFRDAVQRYPGKVGTVIGYDEQLSHLMQGGSDAILIPSRFEPCGLTQLYGLRYGTLPVVARTGGLADTVIDASPENIRAKRATGFLLSPVSAEQLRKTIQRACDHYDRPRVWQSMMGNAMRYPVSWERSVVDYHDLYKSLAN